MKINTKILLIILILLFATSCTNDKNINKKHLQVLKGKVVESFNIDPNLYSNENHKVIDDLANGKIQKKTKADFDYVELIDVDKYNISAFYKDPLLTDISPDDILILDETDWSTLCREITTFDYNNGKKAIHQISIDQNNTIYDIAYGKDFIYFVEASTNMDDVLSTWKIKKFNIITQETDLVDTCENYTNCTLQPRIWNEKDLLIYTIGEEIDGDIMHKIMLYKPNEDVIETLKIKNIMNPYSVPKMNDGIITFPEYFSDGWHMLYYDIASQQTLIHKMSFISQMEYPRYFTVINNNMVYISSFNVLYMIDMNTDKWSIIDHGVHTVGILEDNIIYSTSGLYIYSIKQDKTTKVFDYEDMFCGYFIQDKDKISLIGQEYTTDDKYLILITGK
jgi:hypothetical protein